MLQWLTYFNKILQQCFLSVNVQDKQKCVFCQIKGYLGLFRHNSMFAWAFITFPVLILFECHIKYIRPGTKHRENLDKATAIYMYNQLPMSDNVKIKLVEKW